MTLGIPLAFFFGGAPSTPEMMFVLLAVLLLFGAKRLPEIARNLGRSMEEFRRAARDVSNEIMNADKAPPKPLPSAEPKPEPSARSVEFEEPEPLPPAPSVELEEPEAVPLPDEDEADAGTA